MNGWFVHLLFEGTDPRDRRFAMDANVIIVGGGPAGIITALIAKSVYPEKKRCVVKEIGDGVIPCAIP